MITKYKIFEAQVKEDGPYKYEVGDIVKYRPTKRSYPKSKLMYKIIERKSVHITLFSGGPTRSVRKNAYILKSDEGIKEARESDIRKMRAKEIEQYNFEKEINKYNL